MRKSIGTRIKLLLSSYPSLYLIDPFILIQTPLLKKLPILDAVVLSVTCEQKKKNLKMDHQLHKSMNQV